MPCEPIRSFLPAHRARFPEVVVDTVGAKEPAEGHLHPTPHSDCRGIYVGELDRVAAPAVMDTRAGGMCTAPEDRSREPTKPNFQSSLRWAAELETRAGSGRRGG